MTAGPRWRSRPRKALGPVWAMESARASRRRCSNMRRVSRSASRRTRMLGSGSCGLSPVRLEDPRRGQPGKHTGVSWAALVEEPASLTLQEAAVARLPQPLVAVDDDLAAAEHHIRPTGHRSTLVARVVDRHVVGLRRDGVFAL